VRVLEFAVITSTVSHCSAAAADPHRVHLVHGVGAAAAQVHQSGAAEGGHLAAAAETAVRFDSKEGPVYRGPALVSGLSRGSHGVRSAESCGRASARALGRLRHQGVSHQQRRESGGAGVRGAICAHRGGRLERGVGRGGAGLLHLQPAGRLPAAQRLFAVHLRRRARGSVPRSASAVCRPLLRGPVGLERVEPPVAGVGATQEPQQGRGLEDLTAGPTASGLAAALAAGPPRVDPQDEVVANLLQSCSGAAEQSTL